jgi:hypothetical protein
MTTVVSLAAENQVESPVPPSVIGIATLVILMALLLMTLSFGKGRRHS